MWSISLFRPLGSSSARPFTLFASVLLTALIAVITTLNAPLSAQANPGSDSITYNEDTYSRLTPIPNNDPTYYSSACGRRDVAYIHIADGGGAHIICSDNMTSGPIQFVWFPNTQANGGSVTSYGTLTEREKDAIIAIQNRYELEGLPRTPADAGEPKNSEVEIPSWVQNNEAAYTALYEKFNANVRDQQRITLSEEDLSGSESIGRSNTAITTCDSNFTKGIGWLICPITNWLAGAMDALYGILQSFLTVTPITESRSLLYVWGVMRGFANILFIIGFLFIIYSQITSVGISNYGIKRLLPRLVIAAVLVNISYWVVAAAVDLSNILGVSIKGVFDTIATDIPQSPGETRDLSQITWGNIAGFALSGGMASAWLGGLAVGAVLSVGASLYFLIPALMGVIVAALVAILVLAVRQALIMVLIVIAPLALVAYLLPSTEKYFERWRTLLMTMLLLYPAVAVVFGAAHLAGMIIINGALDGLEENPEDPNFFNVIVLGMIVQVAPVVVTPLLVKLSGSLIARIAGIVNDPNKGIIDKSRKFAQERHDFRKNKQLGEWDPVTRQFRHNNPAALIARKKAFRDMDRSHKLKAYESGISSAYENTHAAHDTYKQTAISEMVKSRGESQAKTEFARDIASREALQRLYFQQQAGHEESELETNRNKALYEAIKTKPATVDPAMRDIANEAHRISSETLDVTQRQASIHQEHESQYWRDLTTSAERQAYAGAAGINEQGEARIANIARQKQTEEREKIIAAGISTINQLEITNQDKLDILFGIKPSSSRAANLRPDFHKDIENRSAVIRSLDTLPQFELHNVIEKIIDMTEDANGDVDAETLRSELVGYLQSKRKPIWISNTILNNMKEGSLDTAYNGPIGRNRMIKEELFDKRGTSAKTLSTADRDDLRKLANWVRDNSTYVNDPSNIIEKRRMQEELIRAYKDSEYAGDLEKRVNELDDLWVNLGLDRNKDIYRLIDGEIRGL